MKAGNATGIGIEEEVKELPAVGKMNFR